MVIIRFSYVDPSLFHCSVFKELSAPVSRAFCPMGLTFSELRPLKRCLYILSNSPFVVNRFFRYFSLHFLPIPQAPYSLKRSRSRQLAYYITLSVIVNWFFKVIRKK